MLDPASDNRTTLTFFKPMPIRIRHSAVNPLVFSLILGGCAGEPTAVQPDRVFTLVGTLGVARWTSADVPGSTEARPGTTLPAFLVCETENADPQAKAAAVVDRATLTLRGDGTSELELTSGTWWRAGETTGGSGGTISEVGRWTEPTAGTIHLTGFSTAVFNAPLQYTDAGGGLTAMTFKCPGGSSAASLTPQLVFSRAP